MTLEDNWSEFKYSDERGHFWSRNPHLPSQPIKYYRKIGRHKNQSPKQNTERTNAKTPTHKPCKNNAKRKSKIIQRGATNTPKNIYAISTYENKTERRKKPKPSKHRNAEGASESADYYSTLISRNHRLRRRRACVDPMGISALKNSPRLCNPNLGFSSTPCTCEIDIKVGFIPLPFRDDNLSMSFRRSNHSITIFS